VEGEGVLRVAGVGGGAGGVARFLAAAAVGDEPADRGGLGRVAPVVPRVEQYDRRWRRSAGGCRGGCPRRGGGGRARARGGGQRRRDGEHGPMRSAHGGQPATPGGPAMA